MQCWASDSFVSLFIYRCLQMVQLVILFLLSIYTREIKIIYNMNQIS